MGHIIVLQKLHSFLDKSQVTYKGIRNVVDLLHFIIQSQCQCEILVYSILRWNFHAFCFFLWLTSSKGKLSTVLQEVQILKYGKLGNLKETSLGVFPSLKTSPPPHSSNSITGLLASEQALCTWYCGIQETITPESWAGDGALGKVLPVMYTALSSLFSATVNQSTL